MMLTQQLLELAQNWRQVFAQERSLQRSHQLMLALLLCVGRKWITRIHRLRNLPNLDWSADYKLFSRAPWDTRDLFLPTIRESLPFFGEGPIMIAGDETRTRRAGKKVKRVRWTRDPLSPPFHVNFIKGIRWVQFSALVPLEGEAGRTARGLPISFSPVDLPPKPGPKASDQEKAQYKKAKTQGVMCTQTVEELKELRARYDQQGAAQRLMLVALDGGFCNRKMFTANLDRTVLIARCRKDAVLCHQAQDPQHPRRVYSPVKFSPNQIAKDHEQHPWQKIEIFFGGRERTIRYKEVTQVLWQGGARRKQLRLIVLAPTPYQLSPNMPKYYRQHAYLLVDDHNQSLKNILQCYFDRWQIEVNHREEKQDIGITHAQVWNDLSVDRVPTFKVAAYSMLLLASLKAFGPDRTSDYPPLPRWRKGNPLRPSCLDMIQRLRQEVVDHPELFESENFSPNPEQILLNAA